MNIPAMAALNNEASAPAATALNPKRAISPLRFGARLPSPPSKIPSEDRLAKPHNAKEIIATVLSDRFPISGAKAE